MATYRTDVQPRAIADTSIGELRHLRARLAHSLAGPTVLGCHVHAAHLALIGRPVAEVLAEVDAALVARQTPVTSARCCGCWRHLAA